MIKLKVVTTFYKSNYEIYKLNVLKLHRKPRKLVFWTGTGSVKKVRHYNFCETIPNHSNESRMSLVFTQMVPYH